MGIFVVLFFAFGIFQIYAGYIGIENEFGAGWAIAALVASLGFRFTLPITIGSFFCAMNVWGWHWTLAFLFAAPGILFMIPSLIAQAVPMARSSA